MALDLTKAILFTSYNAFKNNTIYTGTFSISGTATAGTNTKTFTISLNTTPDITDAAFNGPTDTVFSTDPRPSDGWFKEGQVWVIGNGSTVSNYPTPWRINSSVTGNIMTVTAIYVQTFVDTVTLVATNFSYRLVDYSAF